MGNAVFHALLEVFLPLIVLILAAVGIAIIIKVCERRSSERSSDDYLVQTLLSEEADTTPLEEL